jgi:hypothetical protein
MPVIAYTVAATFRDAALAAEWLRWLEDGHLAEVLAGGATDAEVVALDGPEPSYEVRYHFPSREAFERYEREHAPRLRAEGLRRFPPEKGVTYRRSVGTVAAARSSGHCSAPYAMTRSLDEIVAGFDALTAHDFDYANAHAKGWERLENLCDEMCAVNNPAVCAPVLFRTMERLDGVELGAPGPLVHTLEGWRGGYEALLAESVRRKPVPLTVWMVNRILNAHPPDAESWLGLLRGVADDPSASAETKAQAAGFIEHQAGRTRRCTGPGPPVGFL